MPNFVKKTTEKLNAGKNIISFTVKDNIEKASSSQIIKYAKRRAARRAEEKIVSHRFTEIASKDSEKPVLQEIDAPPTIKEKSKRKLNELLSYIKIHKSPSDERAMFHINPKHLFGILGVICLALIIASSLSEKVREPFKIAASFIVVPAQKGVNSVGLWFSDQLELKKNIAELESSNAELKKQIDTLTAANTTLRQQEVELNRLRELLELSDDYADYEMEGARIVAKDSSKWFSTFTIDKGSNNGIKKDMNVIAGGGLVGIVTDVGLNYSTVRSIIDDDSSVSAKFEYNSELCIVNGDLSLMENNLLEFVNVSDDVILKENTPVITSHISSKFLPGILIGYVADFHLDANSLTQSGHIIPVVDFTNLEEVLVITQLKEVSD